MQKTMDDSRLVSHLLEIRKRLLRTLIVVAAIFLLLLTFSQNIYAMLAQPLLQHLPQGNFMIATAVTSSFLTPLKLTFICAVLLAVPLLLYELWGFVAPGLYAHEKRLIFPLLLLSTGLFFTGIVFAYYVVFPLVFAFFIHYVPAGVKVMPDIGQYLDFAVKLCFAFACAFQVPVAILVLVWTGITTPAQLAAKRSYFIVGAFVLGMLLTPPDVMSQILLALPLWFLFEVGIFLARILIARKPRVYSQSQGDE